MSVDLEKLAKQVDEALAKETKESLTKWLNERRQNAETGEKQCNLPVVINWVACSERLPEGALGSYLACLENNTVHKLEYSGLTNKWWHLAMGDIKPQNPVKYWAELPEPPCL